VDLPVRGKSQQLRSREAFAHDHFSTLAQTYQVSPKMRTTG